MHVIRLHVEFEDDPESLELVIAPEATVADLADLLDVDLPALLRLGVLSERAVGAETLLTDLHLIDGVTIELEEKESSGDAVAWLDHIGGLPATESIDLRVGRTDNVSPRSTTNRKTFGVDVRADGAVEVVKRHDALRVGPTMVDDRVTLGSSAIATASDRYTIRDAGRPLPATASPKIRIPSLDLGPPDRKWTSVVFVVLGLAMIAVGLAWKPILLAAAVIAFFAAIVTYLDERDARRMRLLRQEVEKSRRLDRFRAELSAQAEREATRLRGGELSVPGMVRLAQSGSLPRRRHGLGEMSARRLFVGYGEEPWQPALSYEKAPEPRVLEVVDEVGRLHDVPISIEHPGMIRVGGSKGLARQWVSAVVLRALWDDPDAGAVFGIADDRHDYWDWAKWLVRESPSGRGPIRFAIADGLVPPPDELSITRRLIIIDESLSTSARGVVPEGELHVLIDPLGHADLRIGDQAPQRISPIGIRAHDADVVARAIARARRHEHETDRSATQSGVRPFRLVDVLAVPVDSGTT